MFRIAHIRPDKGGDIFPRTAFYHFSLQCIRVFHGGVVAVFGIHIAHHLIARLGISRRCPFRHISRHIIQSETVGLVAFRFGRNQVSVGSVGAFARFKVRHIAIVVIFGGIGFPRILVFGSSASGGHFPLGFGGQAILFNLYVATLQSAAKKHSAPLAKSGGGLPRNAHHGMMRVARMRKIVAHIRLVVGVAEIVYPRRGVGINVDDVRVYKVV